MRYHVIRYYPHLPVPWDERLYTTNQIPLNVDWAVILGVDYPYRIEDMKTRTVLVCTFELQHEVWFRNNCRTLKNYKRAITYWNKRNKRVARDRLSILNRKLKTWERRAKVAAGKLRKLKAAIRRMEKKKQHEQSPPQLVNTSNHHPAHTPLCPPAL